MTIALEKYPTATHVLSLDAYYVKQAQALKELIRMYEEIGDDKIILGGPIWYYRLNRLIDNRTKFYDAWGSPELLNIFFSSRRRHTRFDCDWSSDVCSSD